MLILLALGCAGFSDPCLAKSLPSFLPEKTQSSDLKFREPLRVAEEIVSSEPSESESAPDTIRDPFEPFNRLFFQINDKLYFWALKPVASVYKTIVPEGARVCVRNFFSNVTTPVRFANCLLQVNFKGAGLELTRFFVNTTVGLAGFFDPAKKKCHIEKTDSDFGQTLGFYGIGPVFYINWPFLGPSDVRDTAGLAGDLFLNPTFSIYNFGFWPSVGIQAFYQVNETSLRIGDYEALKKASLDPYVAVRDAFYQYRKNKIQKARLNLSHPPEAQDRTNK
jgi:phospholipid-binding lipoprotein MlaA